MMPGKSIATYMSPLPSIASPVAANRPPNTCVVVPSAGSMLNTAPASGNSPASVVTYSRPSGPTSTSVGTGSARNVSPIVHSGRPNWPARSAVISAGIGGSSDRTRTGPSSVTDQITLAAASATYVVPPILAVA